MCTSAMQKQTAVAARAAQGLSFNLINMMAVKRAKSMETEDVTFTCTFR